MARILGAIGVGVCLAAIGGCARSGGGGGAPTGAAWPARTADAPGSLDELAAAYARDMEELAALRERPADARGTPVTSRSGVFIERAPTPEGGEPPDQVEQGSPAVADGSGARVAARPEGAASGPSVEESARALAAALRRRAMEGVSPFEDLSRVAMLESIAPGVLEGLGEDASGDSAALAALLAPGEREALRAARRTARLLAASGSADPSIAADALRSAAEGLEEAQVVRIRRAELCRRVDGFARYETFEDLAFLAGRVNRMIVYTEVDRFRQRPLGERDAGSAGAPPQSRFAVSLTQSLNLYFAEGGLLVWRRPPQTVNDFARDRLRDFYIIDTIDLPATLAAGSYTLKVVVRDEATGQQAESIIPLRLVADPSLARGG